ncbi:MAG: GntR family transcriptional regulator [bacterium]
MLESIIKSTELICEQISLQFKKEIQNGKYSSSRPLPSFSALAQSYGISKSTVHEAFKLLSEQGYIYAKQGKGTFINPEKIKTRKSSRLSDICLIVFNTFSMNDNSMIPLLECLNNISLQKKFTIHLHFIHGMSILSEKNRIVRDLISENRYQGLIIASPIDTGDIKWLSGLKIPFVAATSKYSSRISSVNFNHEHAVNLAVNYFINKEVKNITVFTGPLEWEREGIVPYAREIYNFFRKLEKTNPLAIDFVSCNYDYLDAKKKMRKRLLNGNSNRGIFFQSDIIAKGAIAAIKEMNAESNDLVLVNYCDFEEHIVPVNIKKPMYEMAKSAFWLLNSMHSGQIDYKKIELIPEFIK